LNKDFYMPNKLKMPAFLSRLSRRTIWIIVGVVVLAGAGGFAYYKMVYLPAQTPSQPALQTTTVRQGDLTISASGTGTLAPADQVTFGFGTSGQVTTLSVKVGDQVQVGQVLAELDNTSQQVAYTQAKRALAELTSPYAIATAEQTIATDMTNIGTAHSQLAYLIGPDVLYWEEQIAKAQQDLADAQAAAKASPSTEADQKVKQIEDLLGVYQDKLKGSQDYYKNVYLPQYFTTRDRATGTKYVAAPTDAEIATARANLALDQATLVQDQNYLAALKGEKVPEDATGSNLTTLENAQLAVQTAEDNLSGTRLTAPISGTIMTLDFAVGDQVSAGAGVTIADLSQPYVQIYMDPTDWDKVAAGNAATVTFDALPNQTFTGKVTEVDPGLYTSGNTSAVQGMVLIDPPSSSPSINLPIGSTASVEVIAAQAKNAVLVSVNALHEYAPGKYSVFVDQNGKLTVRNVEIGLMDLVNAEVKSGLQPGEVVSTGIAETAQ
jgi:HlyD family secretion protein